MVDERRGFTQTTSAAGRDGKVVELVIPIDTGLVGSAVQTRQVVNVPHAYADSRFDQSFDQKTGYHTKSVLCVPIIKRGRVRAVIQVINKQAGKLTVFDERDVFLLYVLGYGMADVVLPSWICSWGSVRTSL